MLGGVAGLVAALLALGVAQLVSGLLERPSTPVVSVGGAFVDRTPRWLKEFAIRQFGQHDKQVLLAGVITTVLLGAVVIGVLAARRRWIGYAGVAALGLVAAGAAATRPTATAVDVLPSLVAGAVGVAALALLLRSTPVVHSAGRRSFLVFAGGSAAAAGVAALVGQRLTDRLDVGASRRAVALPKPVSPAPALPAGAQLAVPGITGFYTEPRDFYRVDTALVVPQLSTDDWKLHIHGQVAEERTLRWDDLLAMPMIERDITISCVSNEVGGNLAGNARWLGVPVKSLLQPLRPKTGADQVVSRSVDGMTIGTPTAALLDGRDAMLVVAMNGEPLRPEHGFPVRMVVPGLYGYVSACKWITSMEVTTFAAYDPYWVQRGWKEQAPIKTFSRIDTPKPLSTSTPGTVAVGGVAWAQERGISAVEVRVDEGPWQKAELAASNTKDTWRQWLWRWTGATSGVHTLQVRATDGTGAVQPEKREAPFPSGATGWHSVVVRVG
ncbi:DMSO/TMAO reductase YedYZ molybdopterin-dependent catalytic subunit [Motilibacter rhizosphaerae]|uniref:DMSO/TMAO reductase YedYZ molybdopterin-dependent catalytic subunit n=1 Tax=Motilibacter rhizosphaerae TaxID=598652 RepID=A0A4Q7NT36_9ACTN|nr:molybdopterin-dependent oxidoreductase [Motilibacter rhizosphaerae]RZS90326.1 DMSO/TMAO reductase YedYZ molybdopterin-dependent catalytic subunit [Motilibacter rhizosphaerae]